MCAVATCIIATQGAGDSPVLERIAKLFSLVLSDFSIFPGAQMLILGSSPSAVYIQILLADV